MLKQEMKIKIKDYERTKYNQDHCWRDLYITNYQRCLYPEIILM